MIEKFHDDGNGNVHALFHVKSSVGVIQGIVLLLSKGFDTGPMSRECSNVNARQPDNPLCIHTVDRASLTMELLTP